ncbi:bifunctional lysylphosphatidylglycerol synthetase/lysine--tRNA ligase LysX [Phycicoccus sp. HDW14]|uniref:bifunctional lysylphosphatidylglycerol synthetase/lysine--tRNA ligase LysX n=1 Tax=Phycicoccus sp. HDW14 TaxID=2714941 RepID=UPI001F10E93B|nr:bifunctional lysylphosphatidylglycerol synthetase/lysine--tRNA ligase LysX [Phycicoccus sp. HDW14]
MTAGYALGTATALGVWLFATPSHRPTVGEQLFGVLNVPVARSVLSVVTLALVTGALLTRRRAGLLAAAGFQVVGIVVGVLALLPRSSMSWLDVWRSRGALGRVLDVVALVVGVAALVLLWRARREFRASLGARHVGAAVVVFVGGVVGTLVVAGGLLELTERDGATPGALARAVLDVVAGVGGGHRAAGLPGHAAPWVTEVVATLAGLVLAVTALVLLRPAAWHPRWRPEDEVEVRALLRDNGSADSLGYLATRRDKELVFSPDRQAVVGHAVVAGVSLAAADPVGAPASRAAAVHAWLEEAHRAGWVPAVVSASEDGARLYRAAGLRVGTMGDEAVLERDTWDPASPARRSVQRAARRARRAGVVVSCVRQGRMSAAELAEVTAAAERWRGEEPERGFSMALGRAADPADARVLHVLARTGEGRLVGLLTFVPWGPSGISLDVMRHDPSGPNGVTELMVVELMGRARDLGVARVSLNFCMFRATLGSADGVATSSLTRWGALALGRLDAIWQLERLYRFNRRFDPVWVGRYYCVQDPASLPLVAFAAGRAEGFLPSRRARTEGAAPDGALLERIRGLEEPRTERLGPPLGRRERDLRRRRLAMLEAGREPHPPGRGRPGDTVAGLLADWRDGAQVEVCARVRRVRDHGGVAFLDLLDAGASVQALLEGRDPVDELTRFVDPGDLVRVSGTLTTSRRGVPSIAVRRWWTEAKAVRPVPFDGLRSAGARTRDRTADLLVHPDGAELLRHRSAVVAALRRTLAEEGYLEVETPVLQSVHGGASARPFRTWSNAYGQDLCLRIAPELYLKRLLVGGLGPVFELGRNFRNEGADGTHNPEFTALEVYQPYGDQESMRVLAQRLVRAAAVAVHGAPVVPVPPPDRLRQGLEGVPLVALDEAWPQVPVLDAVGRALGEPVTPDTERGDLVRLAAGRGLEVDPSLGAGELVERLHGELVEPVTATPTFYTHFPSSTSPLARADREDPRLAERWDLVVAGMEVATAYSELTDPLEQRDRLTRQSVLAAGGDPEAMELDEDFLAALELGMPPAGGLGIGVDRLVMLLTNRPVRSVLAFPFVRPERRGSVAVEEVSA